MDETNNHTSETQRQSVGLRCEKVCIFRVPPPIMNDQNKDAYVPSIVSLGPYQKNLTVTRTMDQHKHEAVKRMATRIQRNDDFLVAKVQQMESEIRDSYEEPIETDGEEESFSIMMTNDACFILEFFRCAAKERDRNDQVCCSPIFQNKGYKNCMYSAILTDIMKLENQVPLCILITLLQPECSDSRDNAIKELASILSNSSNLFKGFPFHGDDGDPIVENNTNSINSKLQTHIKNGARHLLDLYRMVIKDRLIRQKQEPQSANVEIDHIGPPNDSRAPTPTAKSFEKAGIEFNPGDIKFEKVRLGNSKLFLPEIRVKYRTETLLRNLMAYEECQRCSLNPESTVISNYVCLLDRLIDSEEDVAVLRESKVIRSFVGSDEVVARMFNNLAFGITNEPPDGETDYAGSVHEFDKVMREAKDHYHTKWNVLMNEFRQAHFSKPWYTVSLLAAIALLVMTVIQTVYSVN